MEGEARTLYKESVCLCVCGGGIPDILDGTGGLQAPGLYLERAASM